MRCEQGRRVSGRLTRLERAGSALRAPSKGALECELERIKGTREESLGREIHPSAEAAARQLHEPLKGSRLRRAGVSTHGKWRTLLSRPTLKACHSRFPSRSTAAPPARSVGTASFLSGRRAAGSSISAPASARPASSSKSSSNPAAPRSACDYLRMGLLPPLDGLYRSDLCANEIGRASCRE